MDVSLAIDPAPSCPGPVENHLSAYFAWDVLPLEVAIIPLKFVAVIAFRHRLKFVVDFVLGLLRILGNFLAGVFIKLG